MVIRGLADAACDGKPVRPDVPIVREAVPADIPAIMALKRGLAVADGSLHAVQAAAADWARDGFGPSARFAILVAEYGGHVIGMAIAAERYSPGWVGPIIVLHDLFVEGTYRGRGAGTALLARVAALAKARGSVMVELTVRAGNPAADLYEHLGFVEVSEARHYVLAGPALSEMTSHGRSAVA